jgi:hypothetical protein
VKQYATPYDYLTSKLLEQIDDIQSHLGRGQVANIEEYRRLVGVIQGLNAAISLLEDLQKRQEQDADE